MQLGRRRRRALVASGTRLTGKEASYAKRLQEPWQSRALYYYDEIPELHFCSQFYAKMMSKVEFYPATKDEKDNLTRITSGAALELWERVQDPGGGRKMIQESYGRLKFVTGEGILLVTGEGSEDERWRFLWREEVRIDDNGVATRRDALGGLTDETGTAYRMWTPHPRFSDLADSPLRAALSLAEEIILLSASVRATTVSRMTNGILKVPTEIAPIGDEDQNVDEDPERVPFMDKMIKHMSGQIENPGSAEAAMSLYVEGAYEYLDRLEWIKTHDPATDYMEKDLREEAIERLSLGLDLPPEALKGLSDANHWTGQQVKWDMWQSHGKPIADQFANDMNMAYLRPALKADNEIWENVVIGYDDSQVVVSPDQTSVADEAMDRVAISFEGYRQLKGIPEDMAPSEEEKQFIFGLKTRDPVVAGLEEQAPAVRGPQAPPGAGQNGNAMTPPQPTGGRTVSRQEAQTASGTIRGAAEMAIRQCRSKAGSRLVSAVKRPGANVKQCPECEQAISEVPNAMVASVLGLEVIEQMAQKDPLTLVRGGTDDFRAFLTEWGLNQANSAVLCERIESYAAATLFDPNTPELPVGFMSHVEHALEVRQSDSAEAAA